MPTHVRYLTGLLLAFLVTGIVMAGTIVPATMLAGRRPRLATVIDVWAFFGLIIVMTLAALVGPVILLLRRWLGTRLTVGRAMAVGAGAGPVMLILTWLIVREENETFGQLMAFWTRLPMELVIGALPHVAAGALFAWWLVSEPRPRMRPSHR